MKDIEINFDVDKNFTSRKRFKGSCLTGFTKWFESAKFPDKFYFAPNSDLSCKPEHAHFFRAMWKMWFFNQYLTEDKIEEYINSSVWEFDSNKISCVRFYAMVCVLRYPTESIENKHNRSENKDKPFPWEELDGMSSVDVLRLVNRNCKYKYYHWPINIVKSSNEFENYKFGSLIQENPERILKTHSDQLFHPINLSYHSYFSAKNTSDKPSCVI